MMNQPQLSSTRCYLAAVALNNAGVHLLENRCIHQAHRTLSDAVAALKGVIHPSEMDKDTGAMLERASRRMVECEPISTQSFAVQSLSVDPSMPASWSFVKEAMSPCSTGWTPVRLELFEQSLCPRDPNLELAAILFNVGITSYLLSELVKGDETDFRHYLNSFRFFSLAVHLSLQVHGEGKEEERECTKTCGLALAFHAVRTIIRTFHPAESQPGREMEHYILLYENLHARFVQWQEDSPIMAMLSQGTFAAAA